MKSKAKLTRLWSILLVLVMLVGLLPTTALADGSTPATETADFSTESTVAAALTLLGSGASWNGTTKTLTLNGVNFTTEAATAVKLPNGAKIVLAEGTTNTITGGNSASEDCYGIKVLYDTTYGTLGDLTIQGPGTLNVTSGTTSRTACYSFGISAAAVTIKSGTVIAKGGTAQMTEDSMSGGIYGSNYITIEGGIVEATGGAAWRSCGFSIGALGNMYISGGTVTATGGTSTENGSYGIHTAYSAYVSITDGSLIAKAGSAPSARALNWAPNTLPAIYWWRSSDSGQYKKGSFNRGDVSTYVEIGNTEPITTYTVTFDANGGTGTMANITGVLGEYTLPANGFTAPSGKQFKGWATSEDGEVISGPTMNVTDDTTLYAIWEAIPVTTYTVTFNANGGAVTPASAVTGADGKLTSLPEPTRSGYTFNGWYTAESGGTKVDTAYVFSIDTTIYAQWTSIPTPTPTYTPPTYKVESEVSKDADGSVSFSQNSAKKGDTVTITVTPDRYYKVAGVTVKDASGRKIAVTDNGDGTFTFQMPDSKVAVEPAFSWDNPFVDVAENDYFAPAVEWALKNSVTDGTGDGTTFSPNAPCTRAQAVTFLWRAAGCPEPESSVNPFTDVEEDA